MSSPSLRSTIEILETRIAPAIYFIQAGSLEVHGSDGLSAQDTMNEADAAADGHSDVAVLVKSGDKVFFDADNSNTLSAGDTLLVKITGGQAMLFFTNGAGPTAGGFDKNEITGAAVSNGFSGTFFTDINGSVATALDAGGNFTFDGGVLTLQPSSVKSLTVKGQVNGDVLAGRNLSKVNIGGKLFNTGDEYSVKKVIATGTTAADSGTPSFNNGANTLMVAFAQPIGGNGGNISDVKIPFGAALVAAGDGSDVVSGKAGNGGSVTKVVSTGATDSMSILAGNGGQAINSGTGGRGGSITKSNVVEDSDAADGVRFAAGVGGNSANGNGGAGGAITQLTVELVDAAQSFTVQAGDGGSGGDVGKGGAGGALGKVKATTLDIDGDVMIGSGNGGQSGLAGGKGGAGGSVTHADLTTNNVAGNIAVRAGSAVSSTNARGADGGKIVDLDVTNLGAVTGTVFINSGSGGAAFGTGNGGNGGAVSKVTHTNKGGAASFGIGSSKGGDVLELTVPVPVDAKGNGGRGGKVSGIVINSYADFLNGGSVVSGGGGVISSVAGSSGNGGSSGAVSGVVIHDFFAGGATGRMAIYAGSGKDGAGEGGRGGNVGAVKNITLDGPSSRFDVGIGSIFSEAGESGSGASAVGGSGGLIKNVHGTAGFLDIVGSRGGDSGDGRGGNGASVTKVNVITTQFIHLIAAGDGGNGGDGRAGKGGSVSGVKTDGDIGDFTKTFGLFASSIVQGGIAAGLGGTTPSSPGTNGSVIDIKAAGIATIIAGKPAANAVSALNGVSKLAKITATALGADTGIAGGHQELSPNGGMFDWDGGTNSTYQPSTGDLTPDGDTAIDGLIVVKGMIAPTLPVTPLKLVLVG